MIISRAIINPDIVFTDYKDWQPKNFSYKELCTLIDSYKNLLMSKGAKKGQSVVIGNQANTSQIALVMACAELGLTIVIVGTPYPPGKGSKDYRPGVIDPKLKSMLPIDYFILDNRNATDKFRAFNDICRFTIVIDEEKLSDEPNLNVYADENTVFLKCTSSGTTGTPKVITHTHSFMNSLTLRNSKQFYGKMGMMTNLAHGSSPAVYFIPGMRSENTTDYISLPSTSLTEIASILNTKNVSLDHLLVPYTLFIDDLYNSEYSMPETTIHTLGIIRKAWVEKNKVKDVISIFGTNETSGPLMLNRASLDDFSEDSYYVPDDFYKIEINHKDELEVTMPIYGNVVNTNDKVIKKNDKFIHLGRSNLYRVNDLEIDLGHYQSEVDKLIKAELIIDTKKDNIYLAVYDKNVDKNIIDNLDIVMRKSSNGLHYISKHAEVEYRDFLNGVKIDKEMLREYFRNL